MLLTRYPKEKQALLTSSVGNPAVFSNVSLNATVTTFESVAKGFLQRELAHENSGLPEKLVELTQGYFMVSRCLFNEGFCKPQEILSGSDSYFYLPK